MTLKKLTDIPDGALMKELDITSQTIQSQNDAEKKALFQWVQSYYEEKLLGILWVPAQTVSQLPLSQQKELWLTGSGKDVFVVVDENDVPVWFELRALCHNGMNVQNKIHRASDWIVINEQSDILLSKRADNKDSYPGYWEMWGWHIDGFDDYEVTLKRELSEELGLWENDVQEIQPLMKFLSKEDQQQQFIKVFVVRVKNTSQIVPEDGETVGQEFIPENEMLENIVDIFEWNDPKYKMIPHQIFCILMHLKKRWKNVDELLQRFEKWKKSISNLTLDKLNLF